MRSVCFGMVYRLCSVYARHCRVGLMALFEDGTKLWCSVHINVVQAAADEYTACAVS